MIKSVGFLENGVDGFGEGVGGFINDKNEDDEKFKLSIATEESESEAKKEHEGGGDEAVRKISAVGKRGVFFGDLKSATGIDTEDMKDASVRKSKGEDASIVDAIDAGDDDEKNQRSDGINGGANEIPKKIFLEASFWV